MGASTTDPADSTLATQEPPGHSWDGPWRQLPHPVIQPVPGAVFALCPGPGVLRLEGNPESLITGRVMNPIGTAKMLRDDGWDLGHICPPHFTGVLTMHSQLWLLEFKKLQMPGP